MKSLEEFNIELKKAEDYLDAMVRAKTANKEDCENVKMLLDNINSIVRNLSIPDNAVLKLEQELTMMFDSDLRVAMALLDEIRKLNQTKDDQR